MKTFVYSDCLRSVMSHPGPEHWKALVPLIGYLKGEDTKGIIIRNPNVIKVVMSCD